MHKRKAISILVAIGLTCSSFAGNAFAIPETIYNKSQKEIITSGVTREKITRLTSEGWLNINVLKADLSNSNVGVDLIASKDYIKNAFNTQTLAESKNAVAAVNAGFFNWIKGTKNVYPDGPVAENGKIITASNEYNRYGNSMATFSVDKLNNTFYNYWKTDITLEAENKKSVIINQYNKPSIDYNDYTILDKKWSDMSIGMSDKYPDIVEMLVQNDRVLEIRKGLPAVKIPENGYVVVTRTNGESFLKDNFNIGDKVRFNIATNPDWTNYKAAVTGSAILVKDGQIPDEFSFNIPGRQPRTAIGTSENGKELYLVSVDGRQKSSIGMTQDELAKFMRDIGAYNSLNLDGGGSTTMVSRDSSDGSLDVVNSPSDGSPRSISTALGLFSLSQQTEPKDLVIENKQDSMFVDTALPISIRGVDKFYNPVEISKDKLSYKVSGVEGVFESNVFRPKTTGKALIKATLDGMEKSFEINVLSSPVELELSCNKLNLIKGDSKEITIKGKNKDGYEFDISPGDVVWKAFGNCATIDKGVLKALDAGSGYIEASIGDAKAYCRIFVNEEKREIVDSFETANGIFASYPSDIKGSYVVSNEQKHSGSYSGKLSYEFTSIDGTRAAYFVLGDNGITITPNATKIGVWVYNETPNPNWLRAETKDSSGKKVLLDLTREMDWTGWKYVEASIEGLDSLSKLTRIYLVQPNPVYDSGSIYLDDLGFTYTIDSENRPIEQPEDTKFIDEADRVVNYSKSHDSFRFSVFGDEREPSTDLEKGISNSFAEKINKYIEIGAFTGVGTHNIIKSLSGPFIATGKGYKAFDRVNSRFIQLNASQKGLRLSDAKQWPWFLKQLDTASDKNTFVFLDISPKLFSDELEGNLLIEKLEEQAKKSAKNVWVFYKGDKNASYTKNGVKYFSLAGFDVKGLEGDSTLARYLLVTVMGDEVTYKFKPII